MNRENKAKKGESKNFTYSMERFADIKILRFQVPNFENLSLKQKIFIYYLSEAALCGRDIIFDQHCKYNLLIRKALEAVFQNYSGDKKTKTLKNLKSSLKEFGFQTAFIIIILGTNSNPNFPKNF